MRVQFGLFSVSNTEFAIRMQSKETTAAAFGSLPLQCNRRVLRCTIAQARRKRNENNWSRNTTMKPKENLKKDAWRKQQ